MIGDRDSDIECGKSSGTFTILIEESTSKKFQGRSNPNYYVKNFKDAVITVINNSKVLG